MYIYHLEGGYKELIWEAVHIQAAAHIQEIQEEGELSYGGAPYTQPNRLVVLVVLPLLLLPLEPLSLLLLPLEPLLLLVGQLLPLLLLPLPRPSPGATSGEEAGLPPLLSRLLLLRRHRASPQ